MRNVNYVDIDFIMEKFKDDELPNINTKEMKVKEWIFEALRKIGSLTLYEMSKLELIPDIDNRIKIPDYINHIITIEGSDGESMVELKDSTTNKLSTKPTYYIRGRYIILKQKFSKCYVEVLQLPVDEKGSPLVLDNEYVISAVLAYLMFKTAKKLWLTNRISYQKYDELEKEWLFYVMAAGTELDTPSSDELEDWDVLNIGFPISKLQPTVGRAGYPEYEGYTVVD